jgi:chromosome segregation ATPase
MTYGEKVVIKPGPRLNLVLGPNGTGKSSLVCALCVCLGGALKLLGRADNPRDFIRRGTLRAEVRVTLSGGGRNQPDVIVGRVLAVKTTATGGVVSSDDKVESIYTVGGQKCTEKDVRAIVADMGVQLDNLCQFLPQDKVVEFARLDAKQLLDATERAVGKGELADQHNILKTKAAVLNERIVVSFCLLMLWWLL